MGLHLNGAFKWGVVASYYSKSDCNVPLRRLLNRAEITSLDVEVIRCHDIPRFVNYGNSFVSQRAQFFIAKL